MMERGKGYVVGLWRLKAGDFIRIELKHDGDLSFPHGLTNFRIFHQIVPLHNSKFNEFGLCSNALPLQLMTRGDAGLRVSLSKI
jgi:hypothetical protein